MEERRIELYRILIERFSDGELRTLCFGLGVDYENLPGEGKADKARELIAYLERRRNITQLVEIGKQLRPDISWQNTIEETGEDSTYASSGQPQTLDTVVVGREEAAQQIEQLRTLPIVGTITDSELLAQVRLFRNQVVAKIHHDYALDFDSYIGEALERVNIERRNTGLEEYFASTRYRIIRPPKVSSSDIELHLAPMDFAYLILLKDPRVPAAVKANIREKISQVANRIPKHLRSNHSYLNGYNYFPLGIEIVLITKDGRTLLRKRGSSVLTETIEWDVAYSGYCGDADIIKSQQDKLDIAATITHERNREIGPMPADPREIVITGLHRNTRTGAIDILGYWKTEASTELLVSLLSKKHVGITRVFKTTEKALEAFVWDTNNLIVDFDWVEIDRALSQTKATIHHLIPEALICLMLASESLGLPVNSFAR
jgi:hypothetical protein